MAYQRRRSQLDHSLRHMRSQTFNGLPCGLEHGTSPDAILDATSSPFYSHELVKPAVASRYFFSGADPSRWENSTQHQQRDLTGS